MLKEFQALPNVISRASDFTVVFSIESLLKILDDFDCVDLLKFCGSLSRFLRTMCGSRTGGWTLPCVMSD
jgi:hypothetical protein